MNKKVFVTGATGNIGSVLTKRLEAQNTDFIAGISASGKSIEGVKCSVINFAELDSLKRAFENIDTLFRLCCMNIFEAMFFFFEFSQIG